jgi:hypothetical protein
VPSSVNPAFLVRVVDRNWRSVTLALELPNLVLLGPAMLALESSGAGPGPDDDHEDGGGAISMVADSRSAA